MATTILTVEDVLRRIQGMKKDIEYLITLEEKWREQKVRFPLIHEGIKKQEEVLKARITQLKTLKVETSLEEIEKLRASADEPPKEEPPDML